jgi:hypothetical protein
VPGWSEIEKEQTDADDGDDGGERAIRDLFSTRIDTSE